MNLFATLRLFALSILVILAVNFPARADWGDDDVLAARRAYDTKNVTQLTEEVQRLREQGHVLAPYADYWLMLLSLEDATDQTVTDFLTRYADYPFTDRLRGEYLKKLGKAQAWERFVAEHANYHSQDNAVACYAAEAAAATGNQTALEAAKTLWMQPKEQAGNCAALYDRMQAAGVLTEDDIWQRFRLALAENRLALAKSIAKRSTSFQPIQYKLIDTAAKSPTLVLSKKSISFKSRFGRETNLFALDRLAKSSSSQALAAFKKVEQHFSAEEKAYFYARLALQAALRHEPEAVEWFQQTDDTTLNKNERAWYARSLLRQQNWPLLLAVINQMEASQAEEGAWRYWKARALANQQQMVESRALLAKLSTERHYYGWLAEEELGDVISAAPVYYQVTDEDVNAIQQLPAIQRAEALQRLDFRWEAKSEWAFATQNFDDKQLLAAAEYAMRKQWYDIAILTADKTKEVHDLSLRYPTPYRDLIKPAAINQEIDEAWVYAITRQESRFMHRAKSGAGASGLMQVMPATAKWAAPRAGISDYHHGMIHELDTNIMLGTYYLRHTLDLMNGQALMATAAYNAGPSRAKKWAADIPLEGPIYAETIPFSETRLYVQKVMANAYLYARRLGLKSSTLKQRLGEVPSKAQLFGVIAEPEPVLESMTETE